MVLDRAGNDLRCRGRATVHEHDQRIFLPTIALRGAIDLLLGSASVMRDDDCTLLEELVRDADAFAQQPARVPAQVEDQTLEVAELIERLLDLGLRRFGEAG